jgi:hypothetical protein
VPAAVHLVLRDADPGGIVIATRDNWTGKAFGLPIRDLQELLPVLSGAGVYVLIGDEDGVDDALPVVYVGEAEDITGRLAPGHKQLTRADVEWRRVVVFASQADDLHKAHVRWLEAELVRAAKTASRCRLANVTTPVPPKLPEFDEVFVRSFLDNMLVLYPLLGVDAFSVPRAVHRKTLEASASPPGSMPTSPDDVLILRAAGAARAKARVDADGRLTLLTGSEIVRSGAESESKKVAATRRLLEENVNVTPAGEGWWKLAVDHGPLSPSAAAELVVGHSINGRVSWKTEGGVSYADLTG